MFLLFSGLAFIIITLVYKKSYTYMEENMFCKNCGNQVDSSLKFCTKCGTRIEDNAKKPEGNNQQSRSANYSQDELFATQVDFDNKNSDNQQANNSNYVAADEACDKQNFVDGGNYQGSNQGTSAFGEVAHVETAPEPKKKKGKLLKRLLMIFIPIILVVALGIAAFAHPVWRNRLLRVFLSERTYFKYVMGTNIEGFLDDASSDVKMIKNIIDGKSSVNMELQMELGDGIKDYIDKSAGMKVSPAINWLKSVGLCVDAGRTGDVYGLGMGLLFNGKTLADADVVMKNGGVYVSLPSLTDTGVRVVPETPKQKSNNKKTSQTLERVGNLVPNEDVITDMITRYALCIVNNTKNIKEEDFTVKVGDISQKAIGMTMELDAESMLNISKSCLEELKDDKDVKNIIKVACQKGIIKQKFDAAYKDFQQSISDSLKAINQTELSPEQKEEIVPLRFIANSRGELIGMDLISDEITMKYYNIQKGNKYGTLLLMESDIYTISYEGVIAENNGKYNGTYTMRFMGVDICDVKFENIDKAKYDNGILNGKIIVQTKEGFNSLMSQGYGDSEMEDMFSGAQYVIESSATQAYKGDAKVTLVADGKDFIKYSVKYDLTKKAEYNVPDSYIDSTNDRLMEELEEKCMEAVLDRLSDAGLPSYFKYLLLK